ncbi:MAG: hypothetical protein ACPGSO_08420 [Vicingaceae bacterium]
MKRVKIIRIHIVATIVAILTIGSFFSFSLIAEIIGDDLFIKEVKTGILYCLPIMIITMPTLMISGKKLGGKSKSPIVLKKMNRMNFVSLNGVVLISLVIYLYYHATYKTIDNTFLFIQIAELCFGAANLSLIASNIYLGMKLSGRKRKKGL